MRNIIAAEALNFPDIDLVENFQFDCTTSYGNFNFLFKWMNGRWNSWVTLPDGTIRQAGVYPNVISWTGHTDYGIVFVTDLTAIDYSSLFLTELKLLKWE